MIILRRPIGHDPHGCGKYIVTAQTADECRTSHGLRVRFRGCRQVWVRLLVMLRGLEGRLGLKLGLGLGLVLGFALGFALDYALGLGLGLGYVCRVGSNKVR